MTAVTALQTRDMGAFLRRSDGVRAAFGISRRAKKVLGVASLCQFLAVSYRQLGVMLQRYTGRVYSKSSVGTWAMYEGRTARVPAKHRMPVAVGEALRRLFRDAVYWLTDGRYAVRVSGMYHWRVRVVRV
jgi:hypothetical protein